jgi:hypothetical protein
MRAEPWVIVVATAPSEPDSREMLELVLAGATIEVPMVVVFDGVGQGHLEPDEIGPWRQLIDFDLARLTALEPDSKLMPAGVSVLQASEFDALRRESAGVLRL